MKVIVSREASKGDRPDDFHHTSEGEILSLVSFVCEGDEENREHCGCGRAFQGSESALACTVGVVEERDEDDVLYRLEQIERPGEDEMVLEVMRNDVIWLSKALADAPVGTPVRVKNSPKSTRLLLPEPHARGPRKVGDPS